MLYKILKPRPKRIYPTWSPELIRRLGAFATSIGILLVIPGVNIWRFVTWSNSSYNYEQYLWQLISPCSYNHSSGVSGELYGLMRL